MPSTIKCMACKASWTIPRSSEDKVLAHVNKRAIIKPINYKFTELKQQERLMIEAIAERTYLCPYCGKEALGLHIEL